MGVQSVRGVAEAGSITNPAVEEAGQEGNAVRQILPDALAAIGGRVGGWLTPLVVDHQRILLGS